MGKELLNGTISAKAFFLHGFLGSRGLLELGLSGQCLGLNGSSSLALLLCLGLLGNFGSSNLLQFIFEADLTVMPVDPCSSTVGMFGMGGSLRLGFHHGEKGCKGAREQGNKRGGKKSCEPENMRSMRAHQKLVWNSTGWWLVDLSVQ